jgi:hypothetical protein
MMIIAAVMALLIIIAGVIGFFVYHNNQVTQDHIHAIATVAQTLANNHATATVVSAQNAAATVVAIPGLTATAVATSPYAPFTKVLFYDPLTTSSSGWNEGSACQLSPAGYQVSVTRTDYNQYCLNTIHQYSEIAYQVMMTIYAGDCGGLAFGYNDVNNLYLFEVCQDGTYNMYSHLKGEWISLYPYFRTSSQIRKGLEIQNTVAITVNGDIIDIYVNGKEIDIAKDFDFTGEPIRNGEIGLLASDKSNSTSVTYNNVLLWSR